MTKLTCLRHFIFSVCTVCVLFSVCEGTCTFPSPLTGIWYSSHEGSLAEQTWTSTTVSSFTYTTQGSTYSGLTMGCFINSGSYYVAQSTTNINIFTVNYRVYTCWTFTKISSNKYLYRQATSKLAQAQDANVKVLPETYTVSDYTEICDQTTFDNSEYSIMLKNDTASGEKISCPDPLLATGMYTISDSSTSYCNYNSWLDGCTTSGTLTANYTLCNTNIFYSATGVLYCIYKDTFTSSDTDTYYVTLWNTDPNPDGSSTYYFACAVVETSGSDVKMTTYPGECLNSNLMNATYMSDSAGHTIVMSTNSTCVPSSGTDLALILGLTFGLLVFIIILVVVIYIIYTKCYLKDENRPGSKIVPDTIPNTAMSQADKNKRMMFTPAPPRSAGPGGRQNDYYDGGRVGSEISLRPTVSQLANYRTPTPYISDSKVEEVAETQADASNPKEETPLEEIKSETPGKVPDKKPNQTTPIAAAVVAAAAATAAVAVVDERKSPKSNKEKTQKTDKVKTSGTKTAKEKALGDVDQGRNFQDDKTAPRQEEDVLSDAESEKMSIPEKRMTPSGQSVEDLQYETAALPNQPLSVATTAVNKMSQVSNPASQELSSVPTDGITSQPEDRSPTKAPEKPKAAQRPSTVTLARRSEPSNRSATSSAFTKVSRNSLEKPLREPPVLPPAKSSGKPLKTSSDSKEIQRPETAAPKKRDPDQRKDPRDDKTVRSRTNLDMALPEDIKRIQSANLTRLAAEHKKRVALKEDKTKLPKKQKKTAPQAWSPDDNSRSTASRMSGKDMDIDSILDFDTKRFGEPDGAESGVMVDMEGSLPVFSESGDLTPEPTRVTPHGKIEKPPRRPKPTPSNMPL